MSEPIISPHLEKCWYPIAWSHELERKPLKARILGRQLVAFRGRQGTPIVLEDRCPHRGVELSAGDVVDGCIRCPYHGWRFGEQGKCVQIPTLEAGDAIPNVSARCHRVHEAEGAVWVCLSQEPYTAEPQAWQYPRHQAFTTVLDIECDYIRVMENLVDASHAGYLHAGLLRGEPQTAVVAEVNATPTGVHIQTRGEKARSSFLYRLFGREEQDVFHAEELVVPHVVKLIYRTGSNLSTSQFVCVPVDEHKTRMFCRITADFSLGTPLLFPVFKRVIQKILVQDKAIMENTSKMARLYPDEKLTSTKADVPSLWLARAARAFALEGPAAEMPKQVSVGFRL
ncbi:aromatic ring-hydroxylating dioxygenase subunit alpha [Archangium violaceum]|uniref:aromatic ring-hydroxylating oxygenase subunit alpha n=1 Tax=Archangium violaceum TaxID=83451 RepID=UPI00193B0F46|nr:aromatic ring-hydroxylating dioxygenase subunit alpha [Archangium violaceum]QRK08320.1 aromatic ring-hydroxylating dioxygenase subunit alpha [Archangium violaceum]